MRGRVLMGFGYFSQATLTGCMQLQGPAKSIQLARRETVLGVMSHKYSNKYILSNSSSHRRSSSISHVCEEVTTSPVVCLLRINGIYTHMYMCTCVAVISMLPYGGVYIYIYILYRHSHTYTRRYRLQNGSVFQGARQLQSQKGSELSRI